MGSVPKPPARPPDEVPQPMPMPPPPPPVPPPLPPVGRGWAAGLSGARIELPRGGALNLSDGREHVGSIA
jgi:hypothetical protein